MVFVTNNDGLQRFSCINIDVLNNPALRKKKDGRSNKCNL